MHIHFITLLESRRTIVLCDQPLNKIQTQTCQLMVISSNSMPAGIPQLGCGDEGNCIWCKQLHCDTAQLQNSSIVLQLNYEATQLWNRLPQGSPGVRWPSSYTALLWSAPPAPDWSTLHWSAPPAPARSLWCFSCSRGDTVFSGKEK